MRVVTAVVAVLLAAAVVTAVVWRTTSSFERGTAARPLPPATAVVTRTTLVETKTITGTLGYGEMSPVGASGGGTITWIARVGAIVKRGEPLYRIDERPVVVLFGAVPLYRPLRVIANPPTQGADVRQLQENLSELGYGGFPVDGLYGGKTADAVRSWQTDLGLQATGAVEMGQVVFTPGPVRVATHRARVGDPIGERGAAVLEVTGTTRLVTVPLDVADQGLAAEGRKVSVKVPGRAPLEGQISSVGTVITAQEGQQKGPARIEVTVTIADQGALGRLDAAPVDVEFVSAERPNVLAVPVASLLALSEGRYGVEVIDGDTTRIVPVKTGMFAAGRVEVSGEGIGEGVKVGMPK